MTKWHLVNAIYRGDIYFISSGNLTFAINAVMFYLAKAVDINTDTSMIAMKANIEVNADI